MEQQINQAVEIALSPTADSSLKQQAIDFINQIKSTKEGYQSCINILFSRSAEINDEFKFFILQVIDENLDNLLDPELFDIDQKLFQFLTQLILNKTVVSPFIKNKFANIISKIFCKNYMTINPNFLKQWLSLIKENNDELSYDYYLRIMISIHEEVGDKLIMRSDFLNERNQYLKDKIRVEDMNELIESWFKILQLSYSSNNEVNMNNSLIVIGSFVNWMEISLFINKDCLQLFNEILINRFSCQACLTMIEIFSKKMKPEKKFELLNLLDLSNVISNLDYTKLDLDFMENLSKLVSAVSNEFVIIMENNADLTQDVMSRLLNYWQLIFNFLSNDYDEISSQTFPFIQNYLILSRKNSQLLIKELFETLLNKIIIKMKFDDESFDVEDDEAIEEFKEFRIKLKYFQDSIAGLLPELYVNTIPVIINESLFDENNNSDWNNFELGLFQLINFHDSIKNNLINQPKNDISSSKPMELISNFFIKLINLPINKFNHEFNQLNLFEIIMKFFNNMKNEIKSNYEVNTKILELFMSNIGIFNMNEKVKYRCWYLFFRFVKTLKPNSLTDENFLNQFIINLNNGFLVIKAELPTKDDDSDINDESNFNNQLYLFESIGLLISIFNISNDSRLKFIDLILQPLFADLENLLKFKDKPDIPLIHLQIHHNLMAIGTFARGYHYENKNKYDDIIVEKFISCCQVIVIVLENFSRVEIIRESSRFAFSRFIPILQDKIITELNKLITIILSSTNLKTSELIDFISFMNQITHSYQDNENIYNLLNNLLTPLIKKIFDTIDTLESMTVNKEFPDLSRDKISLMKSLLTIVTTLISNHQTSLLITETNKLILPPLIDRIFVMCQKIDEDDPSLTKLAIAQLMNMVSVFKNGKIQDEKDKFSSIGNIEGIDNYLILNSIRVTFELPFKFDTLSQQNKNTLQDLASLLKTMQIHNNNEAFLETLSNYLSENGINNDIKVSFCKNLVELDIKEFRKYFVAFITQLRG